MNNLNILNKRVNNVETEETTKPEDYQANELIENYNPDCDSNYPSSDNKCVDIIFSDAATIEPLNQKVTSGIKETVRVYLGSVSTISNEILALRVVSTD